MSYQHKTVSNISSLKKISYTFKKKKLKSQTKSQKVQKNDYFLYTPYYSLSLSLFIPHCLNKLLEKLTA